MIVWLGRPFHLIAERLRRAFKGELAVTLYPIKRPHLAKAGSNTTCTPALIDPELAVVLKGKKSAPQVPREWKNNSPT